MTSNRNSNATEDQTAVSRRPLPFLGLTSLIVGAIMPTWATVSSIAAGPEEWGWVPVSMLVSFPFNLVALLLFLVAVVCGVLAWRNAGADRVLGLFGMILAGVQLIFAAILIWVLTFGMVGI